jgi:hypothetical protein
VPPEEILARGREILDPLLEPLGFHFTLEEVGRGSGGPFAFGTYRSGSWVIELHVRWALGIVNYGVGATRLEHKTYMEFLGVRRQAAYPGFSADPLDGFRHLRADLEQFAGAFLRKEDAAVFEEYAHRFERQPDLFKRLP